MAIINISRQPYSSGDEISQEVADRLSYKLIDKSVINNKVKEFHLNFSDELNDLADEKEPGFFKTFFKNPQVYNCLLQSILYEEASNDNVVIKGRGGHFILNQPFVLNVRIVSPFPVRCSNLAKAEGIKPDVAERVLEKKDQQRENFIQYLFKEDIADASFYDLIFNHHKLETNVIVSTILEYVKRIQETNSLSATDKDKLKRMSLEKRVEASIRKDTTEHVRLKVECESLGDIKITGFASDEIERSSITDLAKSCHGVTSVLNELSTVRLQKP